MLPLTAERPTSRFRRLARAAGIDRAVGFTLLTQVWNLVSRPLSVYMTLRFLSPAQQGYFYTFTSILGLQVFFELGIGVVMQQTVSHETGQLHWTDAGTLTGDPIAKSRLASLLRMMAQWYAAIALAATLTILPVGWWMFARKDVEQSRVQNIVPDKPGDVRTLFRPSEGHVDWRLPWTATVAVAAAYMLLTPTTMLLAGCGRVADVAQFGSTQAVALNLALWAVLALGGGLLAAPAGNTVAVLLLVGWLVRRWSPVFRDLWTQPRGGPAVDWWREVWPFQWKVSVSWPFGYLVYGLFTPVLFEFRGAEEAGKMGISLALASMLTNVSMSWINPKMPAFGQMIARRDWAALDRTFRAAFLRSTALAVVGAAALWVAVVVLQASGHRYGDRFLPPLPMALLAACAVVNHVVWSVTGYIRAHKRDPFVATTIAMGLTLGTAVLLVGRPYGATGMAIAYLVLNVAFGAVFVAIAERSRRQWHTVEPAPQSAAVV